VFSPDRPEIVMNQDGLGTRIRRIRRIGLLIFQKNQQIVGILLILLIFLALCPDSPDFFLILLIS